MLYYQATRLPVQILSAEGFARNFDNYHDELDLHYWNKIKISPGQSGYLITDKFLFFGKIRTEDGLTEVLVGPCTDAPCDLKKAHHIRMELNQLDNKDELLQSSINGLQTYQLQKFLQHMNLLQYLINGSEETILVAEGKPPVYRETIPGVPYEVEKEREQQIMDCITFGKTDPLAQLLHTGLAAQLRIGRISEDSLQDARNTLISMITLAARAAVKGGLNYNTALKMEDSFFHRVQQVFTFNSFYALLEEAMLGFSRRVEELMLGTDASSFVREVSSYITANLYEPLTVEHIAKQLNMNRSLLSRKFTKETGRSLSEYILELKIREAIRLLGDGKYRCAQVADQLGFSSASRFSKAFQQITGETPGSFLRSNGCG